MANLSFSAPLTIRAGKQRRFAILAYSGGLMNVGGFDLPVVVDLAGLETPATLPIVSDHELTLEATLGIAQVVENDGRQLRLSGPITGTSQRAQSILAMADSGHPWQASVGVLVQAQERIPAGQTVRVNGQQFRGPVIVARQGLLRETSVLPVGADSGTEVNLAASAALKGNQMTFEEWLAELGIENPDEKLKAILMKAYEAEVNPQATGPEVNAGAQLNLKAQLNLLENRIMHLQNGLQTIHRNQQAGSAPNGRARTAEEPTEKVLSAAFCLTAGLAESSVGKAFGERVTNRALQREFRSMGLHGLMHSIIQAAGRSSVNLRGLSLLQEAVECNKMLQAAGTAMSLPGILSDSMNKMLLNSFNAVEVLAGKIARKTNVSDFKEFKRYRLTGSGTAKEIAKNGQIQHITLQEEEYSGRLKTSGAMISLPREEMINDDLDAFSGMMEILARVCVLAREKKLFQTWLGAGSFFSTQNGNYFEGASSNLQSTSLQTALQMFRQQTDANGDPILLSPQMLLVPPELEIPADNLLAASNVVVVTPGSSGGPTTSPDRNPHAGKYELLVSPYLSNESYAGYSATAWYLLANPADVPALLLAYLDGRETPIVEQGDAEFNTLGMNFRAYYDFGVSLADGRGAVKSKGAA